MQRTRKKSVRSTIETPDDIKRGCRQLRKLCPQLKKVHTLIGDPPLRRREAGFPGLARIVVGQQLSIASADAIWNKVSHGIAPLEPAAIAAHSDEALRALGLSRPKVKTLRNIAEAAADGRVDFSSLQTAEPEEVHTQLTSISGIGPWSADIYCLFCLGMPDAFAPGDLALQEATRMVFKFESRPGETELIELAERWRPWRGVAARLLWAYYAKKPGTAA